jgi:hypothetical protein
MDTNSYTIEHKTKQEIETMIPNISELCGIRDNNYCRQDIVILIGGGHKYK